MTDKEKEITAIESARRLGIAPNYCYGLLWTGKLRGRKKGKRWLVSTTSVQEWLRRREKNSGNSRQFPAVPGSTPDASLVQTDA